MVIQSQSQDKTGSSHYKDENPFLHTAEVFHYFQCHPVVWIALLVASAQNHELESSQSRLNKEKKNKKKTT